MKLLLDTCVRGGVLADIQAAGHDAIWVGDWDEDPGDEEILARALAEGRILVTLDKDFGELAIGRGLPHGGILRLVNFPARHQAKACLHVLSLHGAELEAGALVTAQPGVLRIRLPDSANDPGSP
jgi:predicted nuclease of predicted toxin-antitoxin system